MINYNYKNPLISIHIPKCGGKSLSDVLSNWFGDRYYLHYFNEAKGLMPNQIKTKSLFGRIHHICIHGHFNKKRGFGIEDYYPNQQLITFLRDPLDVALSVFFYNHKLNKEGNLFRDGKKGMDLVNDVDAFLENTKSYFTLFLPDMNKDNYRDVIESRFIHVGIMEDYQHSLDLLADKLFKPRQEIKHINKSERFQTPSESSVKIFKEKCQLEYQIYNYAIGLNS